MEAAAIKTKHLQQQGTMYKGSKALDVQREKSLEKLPKKKMKYVLGRGRTFPKYFSSKSVSVLPFNHFKLPTLKYGYDATVVVNQNQFLSKI